jgi:hypothetical protein
LPLGALANGNGSEVDSWKPVNLPAPVGLRALQDAVPVWLHTLAPASRRGSLTIQYRGESFAPLDSIPNQPCFEACPFPVSLELFGLESGSVMANADQSYFSELASQRLRTADAAGFALEELDLPVGSGFSEPLYFSCDFPLCPVWLPALFDEVGGLPANLRLCHPQPVLEPVPSRALFLPADGPGFSGRLECPTPAAAIWEFRKSGKPEEVSVSDPVSQPAPQSGPAQTAPQRYAENPWQRALRVWRRTPALVRCLALVVPLTVPTLFYGPNISLQSKWSSARASSWASAVKARATIDLRDDFQNGFNAWNGKPGWQKTWAIDGSGSAQPGRLALFIPTISLTDYRVEFQGQIVSKALGVALRAADTNNYQAVKLGVLKPGPLSTLRLTRYAVIEGREGPKTETPISLTVRSDSLYKLVVIVQGDHFQVTVNEVFADAWTDGRLKSGGIGFFSDKGEVGHVRSVHVIDKDDFLGRLCYQVSLWTADRPTIGEKHE